MLLALSAVSSALDALQSLAPSKSSSAPLTGFGQSSTASFDLTGSAAAGSATGSPSTGFSQISPETMSALIAAQSQSGATTSASTDPSSALQDLFSQIDSNGDGQITKSEFENALGAGGTNLAQALAGASSNSVTNTDGSTTTSITYADGSKVTLTTPAASTASSSATSSYNLIEQLIQREAQALSASGASSLSIAA